MTKRMLILSLITGSVFTGVLFFAKSPEQMQSPKEDVAGETNDETQDYPALATTPDRATQAILSNANDEKHEQATRDAKVLEKLNRFIEKTAHMSAESVAQERHHLRESLQHALSKKSIMPEIREDVDANGGVWEEIDYGDGIIRYLPAVLPEMNL